MPAYHAPLEDLRFALHDVIGVDALFARLPGCSDATPDVVDAVLEEAAKLCEQVLAPLNATGDLEGCRFDRDSASVTTPAGFREAFRQYVEGGWAGLTSPAEFGGQALPEAVGGAVKEMIDAANLAWGVYPLLSHGAIEALRVHGEDWQREVFLKPIVAGTWMGTMCLTEPQCGSDLGLLKTHAVPAANGAFAITGTKIFITAGEHDFTDNIVHLVLARLPDAPPGVKGITLFVVPKFKVGRDGRMGERNAVRCAGIEHKMGIKGSATCVMNFDAAEGWLIGDPHKGLAAMFTMMNTARLAVGMQGVALSERALQGSLAYARERLQMRALSGAKFPDRPADPLVVHPDIRRMLLTQMAFVEGGRVFALDALAREDIARHSANAGEREAADAVVSFLTPIVKAFLTEAAIECTYDAVQVFGGHGYIVDNGMEQLARDARITTIYEGTTQIQALDLLGRKILQLRGAGMQPYVAEIGAFCKQHQSTATLREFVAPLAALASEWADMTKALAARAAADPEEIGAAAVDYLFYSGYVALAYCWTRSVAAADVSAHGDGFKQAKRTTARFYFSRLLPRSRAHLAALQSGVASLGTIPPTGSG